jgi:hypothetical protein
MTLGSKKELLLSRLVLDHLFDHLPVEVQGVSRGSTELHEVQNRLSKGSMGVLEGLKAPT